MKKAYLVSEDEFCGQVVIICETKEVEVDTYVPTKQEMDSAIYLYRELPKNIEKKTLYIIKVFYHYESEENAYLLKEFKTFNKDRANELFKASIEFCK